MLLFENWGVLGGSYPLGCVCVVGCFIRSFKKKNLLRNFGENLFIRIQNVNLLDQVETNTSAYPSKVQSKQNREHKNRTTNVEQTI